MLGRVARNFQCLASPGDSHIEPIKLGCSEKKALWPLVSSHYMLECAVDFLWGLGGSDCRSKESKMGNNNICRPFQ